MFKIVIFIFILSRVAIGSDDLYICGLELDEELKVSVPVYFKSEKIDQNAEEFVRKYISYPLTCLKFPRKGEVDPVVYNDLVEKLRGTIVKETTYRMEIIQSIDIGENLEIPFGPPPTRKMINSIMLFQRSEENRDHWNSINVRLMGMGLGALTFKYGLPEGDAGKEIVQASISARKGKLGLWESGLKWISAQRPGPIAIQ